MVRERFSKPLAAVEPSAYNRPAALWLNVSHNHNMMVQSHCSIPLSCAHWSALQIAYPGQKFGNLDLDRWGRTR